MSGAAAELAPPDELLASGAPVIETEEVPACPVCRHGQFDQVAQGFDYELQTCRNPWRFVRCSRCGHVWLTPRPALSTLPVIYPSTYYAYNYAEQINPIAVKAKMLLDRRKMRGILRRCGRPPHTYLDVGCGDGRFLRVLEAWGLPRDRLFGVDLDVRAVGELAKAGYRAVCQRVEKCTEIPDDTLDLVTMFHVLEHVDDPRAVVHRIRRWMTEGSVLAIETPNIDSLDAQLFRSGYWGGYHIPRHWHLFRPSSLRAVLEEAGFSVVSTSFQTGHSFWMYSFHHRLRYGSPPRPGLARWFDPFRNLLFLAVFTAFDLARAAVGFKTSAMLVIATKSGGAARPRSSVG